MNALVLAAGYATRLRPLTDDVAKSLLPVGGRPMLDWILDKLEEVGSLDAIHVVTNSRYSHDFDRWAAGAEKDLQIVVHDDGTTSNEDRLGAIGDIQLTVERAGLGYDDLLVVAGDNLFDFSLADLVAMWQTAGTASAVALYDCGDLELATHYAVVSVDPDGRVRSFVEKPSDPASTLCATANYVYHRDHIALVGRYLDEGGTPDSPGNFLAWLHRREPVYGYTFDGSWLDIGNHDQLLTADNLLRRRLGLPEVARYELDPE
ncbi:MAG: nucleotidyltransferase family protein [Gaiellaceae bacterium]